MKKVATITTDSSGDGKDIINYVGDEYILELDSVHDDGQAVYVVWEADGEGENRLNKVITDAFETGGE